MLMEESQAPFAKDKENSFQQVGTIVKPLRTCWILSKCQTWVGGGGREDFSGTWRGRGDQNERKGKTQLPTLCRQRFPERTICLMVKYMQTHKLPERMKKKTPDK